MTNEKSVAKVEPTMAERFANKVLEISRESMAGKLQLTEYQRQLCQNYYISLDSSLRTLEEKRRMNSRKKNDPALTWANVEMNELAQNVIAYARMGLDPLQKNHINMIPFKNKQGKYDIGFIEGYRGIEIKATKYGLNAPKAVIVELVYENDKFKPIKKSLSNPIESYEFDVVNPFDRGNVIGGFYYHIYSEPERNKLVIMSMKDIDKRRHVGGNSPEFWGGEKAKWENGHKVGTEKVEGWFEQMCLKTIYRAAYDSIPIDSNKIDNDYLQAKKNEKRIVDEKIEAEITAKANQQAIDVEGEPVAETQEPLESERPETTEPATPADESEPTTESKSAEDFPAEPQF